MLQSQSIHCNAWTPQPNTIPWWWCVSKSLTSTSAPAHCFSSTLQLICIFRGSLMSKAININTPPCLQGPLCVGSVKRLRVIPTLDSGFWSFLYTQTFRGLNNCIWLGFRKGCGRFMGAFMSLVIWWNLCTTNRKKKNQITRKNPNNPFLVETRVHLKLQACQH